MYYFNAQVKDTVQPIDVNERNFPHIWNSKDFSKAIYIEKKDGDIYVETLCKIKWTVDDVREAFKLAYGREGSDDEIYDIVNKIDWERIEEAGIERGWGIIHEVV